MNKRTSTSRFLGLASLILLSACYSDSEGPQGTPGPIIPLVAISPTNRVQLGFGQSTTFTANTAVNWSVSPVAGGSITSSGVFTANDVPGVFIIRASSTSNSANTDTATVEVVAAVQPAIASIPVLTTGQAINFTASTGSATLWATLDAAGGSLTPAGSYLAPNLPGTYRVRAYNKFNTNLADTAFVRVNTTTSPIGYLRTGGYAILFRHTAADVCSDNTSSVVPNWWRTCDANCGTTTARQLNTTGLADATKIGKALQRNSIPVDSILTSEFCRCFTGAELIRAELSIATQRVRQTPILTYFVYDEANRPANMQRLIKTSALNGTGVNRVLVGQAGHGTPPTGVVINMNNLAWGDAFILRLRSAGREPVLIETIPVSVWQAQGS
jgi:hypothetical protein